MTQISRRTLAKGAAWAMPTAAVAYAAPAYAASKCPASATAAIDQAFDAVATSLVAYWTTNTGQNDGSALNPAYININNNLPYAQETYSDSLMVTFHAYFLDTTTNIQNAVYTVNTAYGTKSGVSNETYNGYNAISWAWSAGEDFQIDGYTGGGDSTADMVIHPPGTLLNDPRGTVICAELVSMPKVQPNLLSIIQTNPDAFAEVPGANAEEKAANSDCASYYNNKAAVTPGIRFSGPQISGTTKWNNNDRQLTLDGGTMTWSVGSTICSTEVGNYITPGDRPSTTTLTGARREQYINGIF